MKNRLLKDLKQKVDLLRPAMSSSCSEIVDDLLTRVSGLRTVTQSDGVHLFGGKTCRIALGNHPDVMSVYLQEEFEELNKSQFLTFEENAIYCEGTTNLLDLLIRYRCHRTPTDIITCMPDSSEFVNDQAVIKRESIAELYGDTRMALIIVILKEAFISFLFEEKIANVPARTSKVRVYHKTA